MQYLLECLRRRENWAEEFIRAMEACEHTTMAAEIRAEYNSLRGTADSKSVTCYIVVQGSSRSYKNY